MLKITMKLVGRPDWRLNVAGSAAKDAQRKGIKARKAQLSRELAGVTPVDTGEARDGWEATHRGIQNPVEHIGKLNEGSSKQAPAFFIERTLLSHRDVHPSGIIVRRK
jgi:hypothetical protein